MLGIKAGFKLKITIACGDLIVLVRLLQEPKDLRPGSGVEAPIAPIAQHGYVGLLVVAMAPRYGYRICTGLVWDECYIGVEALGGGRSRFWTRGKTRQLYSFIGISRSSIRLVDAANLLFASRQPGFGREIMGHLWRWVRKPIT